MNDYRLYSLAEAPEEISLQVVKVDPGCNCMSRLVGMGIIPGALLTVNTGSSSKKGPIKISIGETIVALGRGISKKITVKESGGN